MSTDKKPDDPFGVSDLFGSAAASPFDSAGPSPFDSGGDPFAGDKGAEFWDMVSEEAAGEDSPEATGKRVLNEVEAAFKARAQAEQKRMEEAVDSEFWICLVFQTRAQKDQFLERAGVDAAILGDKYIEGPDFARAIGRPVDPVKVRYNNSDKLDRRLVEMSRGLDELPGLGSPPSTE